MACTELWICPELSECNSSTFAGTRVSAQDFIRHPGDTLKAASSGPVFITDSDHPTHVLLSIGDYRRIVGKLGNIADLLALPGTDDVEMEIPPLLDLPQFEDLS